MDRFNQVVHSFLKQSHFIVITHHKRTMAASDLLYGITMQERGVSKRVAVQFDDVGQDGKIAADAIKAQAKQDQAVAPTSTEEEGLVDRRGKGASPDAPEPKMKTRIGDLLPGKEAVEVQASPEPKAAPAAAKQD